MRKSARVAFVWLLLVCTAAVLAPLIAPRSTPGGGEDGLMRSPDRVDLRARFEPPGSQHLLGTDDLGRDVASRMLHGARISLGIGLIASLGSLLIGVLAGAVAGQMGGWVDVIISRVIEAILAIPGLFLVLALVAAIGSSFSALALALVITGWPSDARFVRAEFLRARECDYALAATAAGASRWRTIVRHILPNALSPAIVSASFGVAGAILVESALSFLGFGIRPPAVSWGGIVGSVTAANVGAWWLIVFPGLAIFLTIAAVHTVGDYLASRLDPRSSISRVSV